MPLPSSQKIAPCALYRGKVMHARLKPASHRFSYRVVNILVDVSRLDEIDRKMRLFGVNKPMLFSFFERDHGPRDGTPLAAYVRRLLTEHGIQRPGEQGHILLLCYPRIFGFVFNPLSVYFCYDPEGELTALVYEVRNTFGEMHTYVRAVDPDWRATGIVRQSQQKAFYVSPFITMNTTYLFRVLPPRERVQLRILATDDEGPLLAATFSGRSLPLNDRSVLRAAITLPFMTLKVVAAIHFEALRLWLKGVCIVERPKRA